MAHWRVIPVLGAIALFLGAVEVWPRIMQRRRRAERWVLLAVKEDIEFAAELAEKADLRSLTACGHSPAYDALIKEASRMMPTYAKKLADDFIARAMASGEPRLLANAIALRAVVRARVGPYEDAIADASEVLAMPHATPTARAHAALARVIAGERAERFDEVRAVAIKQSQDSRRSRPDGAGAARRGDRGGRRRCRDRAPAVHRLVGAVSHRVVRCHVETAPSRAPGG